MDSTGTMTEEYSYDAWGRRRSPSDWSYNVTDPDITFRGYTGHEHLDAFGLIHMNGRIYDPHLARVLNPDPVIQDMENIQAYNRYSYCLNNPLKYIDPSGYTNRDNGTTNNSGVLDEWYEMERIEAFERYLSRYAGSGIHHGGGGSGGGYGKPGQSYVNGTNGDGSNGYYYDNLTGTYRDTETGEEVPYWIATNGVRFNSGSNYTGSSHSGLIQIINYTNGDITILYSGDDLDFWYYAWDGEKSLFAYSKDFAPGQEGNGIDGDDIWVGATGTYLTTVGNVGHNAWWWQDAQGAYRSTKLLQVGSNGKYVRGVQGLRCGYAIAGEAASLTKILGNTLGAVGVGISVYDMTQNGINVSNSMDAIMGATTFIPVVGWIISGTYFTASFITELSTGKSISEHAQDWVNTW